MLRQAPGAHGLTGGLVRPYPVGGDGYMSGRNELALSDRLVAAAIAIININDIPPAAGGRVPSCYSRTSMA